LQPVVAIVPASKPAMAAVMTNVLAVLDIVFAFLFLRLIQPYASPNLHETRSCMHHGEGPDTRL
jgi:hypothetical protein